MKFESHFRQRSTFSNKNVQIFNSNILITMILY